jgi:hypothetical protein
MIKWVIRMAWCPPEARIKIHETPVERKIQSLGYLAPERQKRFFASSI